MGGYIVFDIFFHIIVGEEPYDYNTFSKLRASTNEGRDEGPAQAEQIPQKRQQTLSNSSHSSEEVKEKKRSSALPNKDSVFSQEQSG